MQGRFIVTVAITTPVHLDHHCEQARMRQRPLGAADDLRFEALHVDLDDHRRRSFQHDVEGRRGDCHRIRSLVVLREHVIQRIQIRGEMLRSGYGTHTQLVRNHSVSQVIDTDVVHQATIRGRDGLEGNDACSRAGPEHDVGPHVRSHIDEEIARAQRVEHQTHIVELLESAVDVPRGSLHARRHQQMRAVDERRANRTGHHAAPQLPAHVPPKSGKSVVAGERVRRDESKGFQQTHRMPSRLRIRSKDPTGGTGESQATRRSTRHHPESRSASEGTHGLLLGLGRSSRVKTLRTAKNLEPNSKNTLISD